MTTESLMYICRPMLYFNAQPGYTLPERWKEGETAQLRIRAYGVLPLGPHQIHLERIDPLAYRIQSREKGRIVSVWDHLIQLQEKEQGTLYTDEVILHAGLLTRPVAWWSTQLYRHRQRRWQTFLQNR